MSLSFRTLLIAGCIGAIALSCNDSTTAPSTEHGVFVRIPADSAILGQPVQLTAIATGEDSARVAWPRFIWSSSDTSIAIVDSNGVALPVGIGTAIIKAEFDGMRDSIVIKVVLERADGGLQLASVAAGFAQNCALTVTGTAVCRPGGVSTASSTTYAPLPGAESVVLTSLHTSVTHTCGTTADGTLYCWGSNAYGNFLTGTLSPAGSTTAPVPGGGSRRFQSITVGTATTGTTSRGATCGIDRADGLVYCAGVNNALQLGRTPAILIDSTVGTMTTPLTATQVSISGGAYACASTSQDVFCWGGNVQGGVGAFGGSGSDATPRNVSQGTPLTKLTTSPTHACGIAANQRAYCWGSNNAGQLGIGSIESAPHSAILPVQSTASFISLVTATGFTCGLTVDGSIYCWGNFPPTAISSRLGIARAAPVSLVSSGGFTSISTDGTRVCALTGDKKSYCF